MKKHYTFKRLSNSDRNSIEQGLDKNLSAREIARRLDRSVSTITEEIKRNRSISIGTHKGDCVKKLPENACLRLQQFPFVCNGCNKRRYHCNRPFKCEYDFCNAHKFANSRNSGSRSGVDITQREFEKIINTIHIDLKNGLSPYQISISHQDFSISPSTIYRWISKNYGTLRNIDLRRKVKYKPRKKIKEATYKHGINRSYDAFMELDEDTRNSVCEMDTVIGKKDDTKCILTLFLRPCRFQFAILLNEKSCYEVNKALDYLENLFGKTMFRKMFGNILTDNGSEFDNYKTLEKSCLPGKMKRAYIYYCDAYRSCQKASCEKNHVEIRKIIPKKQGISFDLFSNWNMATIMSHVNSSPRKSLGGLTPIDLFETIYGRKALETLKELGVAKVSPSKLCLKPEILNLEK